MYPVYYIPYIYILYIHHIQWDDPPSHSDVQKFYLVDSEREAFNTRPISRSRPLKWAMGGKFDAIPG